MKEGELMPKESSSSCPTYQEIMDACPDSLEEFADWLAGPIAFIKRNLKHGAHGGGTFLHQVNMWATQFCPDSIVQLLTPLLTNPFVEYRCESVVSTYESVREWCLLTSQGETEKASLLAAAWGLGAEDD
jgi:hypothetical protein